MILDMLAGACQNDHFAVLRHSEEVAGLHQPQSKLCMHLFLQPSHMVGDHTDSSNSPHSVFFCNILLPWSYVPLLIRLLASSGGSPVLALHCWHCHGGAWQSCCTGCFVCYQKPVPKLLCHGPRQRQPSPAQVGLGKCL